MTADLNTDTPAAVIGAGSMGAGIAQLAAQSGHRVRLHDAQGGAAAAGLKRIGTDLDSAVERGKLQRDERDATLARIEIADGLDALATCGPVVEAIVERLDPKRALFRDLEAVLAQDAVLAINTSSISITAVAPGLQHPQRLIGWHFFNPATRIKLVEVIAGVETDPALVGALHGLSKAWGKTSVDAANAPGFIVNRVARPYYSEGLRQLAEGLAPAPAIDALMREAAGLLQPLIERLRSAGAPFSTDASLPDEKQLGAPAAILERATIALIALADVAGLGVMRIVCCLANKAADMVTWTGTTARDIDTAMRLGVAYPLGPLAWADTLAPARVAAVLANLQAHCGDPRYRRAPALSRVHFNGATFHG